VAELAEKDSDTDYDRLLLAEIFPEIIDLPSWDDMPDDGMRLRSAADSDLHFKGQNAFAIDNTGKGEGSLDLILVDWTFGTEALSSLSACLQELGPEPCATLQTRDAAALNLNHGDRVIIETDSGSLELPIHVADNMAAGILVIPRHRRINWQIFDAGRIAVDKDRIKKVGSD
jgi:NADH-quinone oxidoreductase subunit G